MNRSPALRARRRLDAQRPLDRLRERRRVGDTRDPGDPLDDVNGPIGSQADQPSLQPAVLEERPRLESDGTSSPPVSIKNWIASKTPGAHRAEGQREHVKPGHLAVEQADASGSGQPADRNGPRSGRSSRSSSSRSAQRAAGSHAPSDGSGGDFTRAVAGRAGRPDHRAAQTRHQRPLRRAGEQQGHETRPRIASSVRRRLVEPIGCDTRAKAHRHPHARTRPRAPREGNRASRSAPQPTLIRPAPLADDRRCSAAPTRSPGR